MATKFDKKIFLNNIEILLNSRNIKVRDLENKAGVSRGYLSRLSREGNQSVPGIDFILAASELFGISVELLSTVDYTGCSETERYYIDFIERLIQKTESGEMLWKSSSIKDFENAAVNNSSTNAVIKREPSIQEMMASIVSGKNIYYSTVDYGCYEYKESSGLLYYGALDDNNSLFLIKVLLEYEGEESTGIEMFIASNDNKKRNDICYIRPDLPQIYDSMIEKLYNVIKDSINVNFIDKDAKAIIDKFMSK